MATKLFLRDAASDYSTGTNNNDITPTAVGWTNKSLSTTAGAAATNAGTAATANGPVKIPYNTVSSIGIAFISPPLSADVTISGAITYNIWASESNMSANVAINARVEVINGATGAFNLIDETTRTTEVAVTTRAANNFAETPAAGVTCHKGERLRVTLFGSDAGTMAVGFTFDASWDGPTAAADGDTFVSFTETFSFASEPAGTQLFPTDTAASGGLDTGITDKEAWTSRGSSAITKLTNQTTSSWFAPVQVTDGGAGGGGTSMDWFTRTLTGFTLGGAVRVNMRYASQINSQTTGRCEIAIVEGDGSSPTVWAAGSMNTLRANSTTTQTALSFLIGAGDVTVNAGQRLRIRFYVDNCADLPTNGGVSSGGIFYYAGSSGASGDSFVTLSQTVSEGTGATRVPKQGVYPSLLAQ